MEQPGYVNVDNLTVDKLNSLIEKGERFYVTYDNSPPWDDSIWTTDYAFWGGGEPES